MALDQQESSLGTVRVPKDRDSPIVGLRDKGIVEPKSTANDLGQAVCMGLVAQFDERVSRRLG